LKKCRVETVLDESSRWRGVFTVEKVYCRVDGGAEGCWRGGGWVKVVEEADGRSKAVEIVKRWMWWRC
jgi:hypothetical protein